MIWISIGLHSQVTTANIALRNQQKKQRLTSIEAVEAKVTMCFALNDVKHLYLDLLFHFDFFFPVYHGIHHYNFQAGSYISWICFFGDCLRIVPFDSSPFCTTIWVSRKDGDFLAGY